MLIQILPNFLVLGLNVLQVLLAGVEVMLILARVKATVAVEQKVGLVKV